MKELIETPACSYYRKPEPRRTRRGAPFQPELQTRDGAFPPVVASIGKNTAEGGYYPRLMTLVTPIIQHWIDEGRREVHGRALSQTTRWGASS
jgi:hypothetical protein